MRRSVMRIGLSLAITAGVLAVGWTALRRPDRESAATTVSAGESLAVNSARDSLEALLEDRRATALELQKLLIDDLIAHGEYVEHFEAESAGTGHDLLMSRFPDAVGVQVDYAPHPEGRTVRTTVIPRGYDATLDALVDEISELTQLVENG